MTVGGRSFDPVPGGEIASFEHAAHRFVHGAEERADDLAIVSTGAMEGVANASETVA